MKMVRKHEDLTFTAVDPEDENIFVTIELFLTRHTAKFKLESPGEEHVKIKDSLKKARLSVIAITAALDHVEQELFSKPEFRDPR